MEERRSPKPKVPGSSPGCPAENCKGIWSERRQVWDPCTAYSCHCEPCSCDRCVGQKAKAPAACVYGRL